MDAGAVGCILTAVPQRIFQLPSRPLCGTAYPFADARHGYNGVRMFVDLPVRTAGWADKLHAIADLDNHGQPEYPCAP
jgi:hypothetical protein